MAKRDAELNKKIGDRLTMARKSSRDENGEPYTQSKILDKISEAGGHSGYDPASVSGWENGKHMPPTIAYKVYSDISGWTVDYLAGLSDDREKTRIEDILNKAGATLKKAEEFENKETDNIIDAINNMQLSPYFFRKEKDGYRFFLRRGDLEEMFFESVLIDQDTLNVITDGIYSLIDNYLASSFYCLCKKPADTL